MVVVIDININSATPHKKYNLAESFGPILSNWLITVVNTYVVRSTPRQLNYKKKTFRGSRNIRFPPRG